MTSLCIFGANILWRKGGLSERKITDMLITVLFALQHKLIKRKMEDIKVVNGQWDNLQQEFSKNRLCWNDLLTDLFLDDV